MSITPPPSVAITQAQTRVTIATKVLKQQVQAEQRFVSTVANAASSGRAAFASAPAGTGKLVNIKA